MLCAMKQNDYARELMSNHIDNSWLKPSRCRGPVAECQDVICVKLITNSWE